MKKSGIDGCVRAYQDGIEAYVELEAHLKAAESATADVPLTSVREARACLAATKPFLKRLANSLAHLPELAVQLTEERRISAAMRRHAMEKGVKARYDG